MSGAMPEILQSILIIVCWLLGAGCVIVGCMLPSISRHLRHTPTQQVRSEDHHNRPELKLIVNEHYREVA